MRGAGRGQQAVKRKGINTRNRNARPSFLSNARISFLWNYPRCRFASSAPANDISTRVCFCLARANPSLPPMFETPCNNTPRISLDPCGDHHPLLGPSLLLPPRPRRLLVVRAAQQRLAVAVHRRTPAGAKAEEGAEPPPKGPRRGLAAAGGAGFPGLFWGWVGLVACACAFWLVNERCRTTDGRPTRRPLQEGRDTDTHSCAHAREHRHTLSETESGKQGGKKEGARMP